MKKLMITAALAASTIAIATPAMAQRGPAYGQSEEQRFAAAQQRFANELSIFQQAFDRYQQNRDRGYPPPPPRPGGYNGGGGYYDDSRDEGDYDPGRYYRDGPSYRERTLSSDERVYRGRDGKYYCKRSDGTTGLIIGGIAGAGLGNVIDGGRSRTAGTVIGALVGAVAGQAIQKNQQELRCR
jgi:hypothetical protein